MKKKAPSVRVACDVGLARTFKLEDKEKTKEKRGLGIEYAGPASCTLWVLCYWLLSQFFVFSPGMAGEHHVTDAAFLALQLAHTVGAVLLIVCLNLTHFTDPGTVKKSDFGTLYPSQAGDKTCVLRVNGRRTVMVWCDQGCDLWRPPAARHCQLCGKCIYEVDHHCGVMGTCIARNNMRWFLLQFVWLSIAAAATTAAGALRVLTCDCVGSVGFVIVLILILAPCCPPCTGTFWMSCGGVYGVVLMWLYFLFPDEQFRAGYPPILPPVPETAVERYTTFALANCRRICCLHEELDIEEEEEEEVRNIDIDIEAKHQEEGTRGTCGTLISEQEICL